MIVFLFVPSSAAVRRPIASFSDSKGLWPLPLDRDILGFYSLRMLLEADKEIDASIVQVVSRRPNTERPNLSCSRCQLSVVWFPAEHHDRFVLSRFPRCQCQWTHWQLTTSRALAVALTVSHGVCACVRSRTLAVVSGTVC